MSLLIIKFNSVKNLVEKFAPAALTRPFHDFDDGDSMAPGKRVYIIHPCMIHGPGNKGNLCFVNGGILGRDVPSGIYHTADDEALSTNELIEVICEALGRKAHIWRVPRGLMNGVAKLGGWLHLPLNPLRMQKLTENYVVCNGKIKRALGVERMPVGAREGLLETLRRFAEEVKR